MVAATPSAAAAGVTVVPVSDADFASAADTDTPQGVLAVAEVPRFGLDTLPALGVVLLSLGVLIEDFALVMLAVIVGGAGIVLELVLGKAALSGIRKLL